MKRRARREDDFFSSGFWRGAFRGIRSMNWECCIEYFIDCLLAPCWPAWHAKFLARWRRHVTSHQPSHPWGSPAFPVNKLAHSGGGREARAQGQWGWHEEKTHTFFLWRTTHNLGYSMNSLGQSPMNPLKASSELKRPETSILITASLLIKFAPTKRCRASLIRCEHNK